MRIQRVWRGSKIRKQVRQELAENYTKKRAATRIQRWFRNLKFNHRKNFIAENVRFLKSFTSNSFYIPIKDYLQVTQTENSNYIKFL